MKKLYLVLYVFLNIQSTQNQQVFNSCFDDYMKSSEYYNPNFSKYNNEWKILKQQFNNFIEQKKSKEPIIPKKIHQIWLGGPLPEKCKKLQQSWIINHPDWEYKLWTEKEINEFKLNNLDLYNNTQNYGEKSDIARYEILYREGGIYVDCDFECLKPFEDFIYSCDFFAGIGYGSNPTILSGIIGAKPGHPILKTCYQDIQRDNTTGYFAILNRTSIFYFTRCFFKSFTKLSIIFPVTFFYPLPDFDREEKNTLQYIKPESYAIHYWHLSWNGGKIF